MAALDGDSLGYLTIREGDDAEGRFWEIGVIGHGPRATPLAEQVVAAIQEWDRDYGNQAPAPGFRMATADHRDLRLACPDRATKVTHMSGDPVTRPVHPRLASSSRFQDSRKIMENLAGSLSWTERPPLRSTSRVRGSRPGARLVSPARNGPNPIPTRRHRRRLRRRPLTSSNASGVVAAAA
ncbi:hypothetical protein ACFSKW_50420 [Nonomuraea mangrovi]|uniref:Uncharacterized protein n=1 Tax=Nonomuraea mangrovi TaxID=2316207 RepID=A0ABW4TG20_9ACTN